MDARLALPVEDLAAGVADRVDAAVLAQRLQVPVDGGQPDACSPLRRSSAWISCGAAKPGRLSSAAARACALPGPRARVLPHTGSSGCGIVTVARYNLHPRSAQRARPRCLPQASRRAVPNHPPPRRARTCAREWALRGGTMNPSPSSTMPPLLPRSIVCRPGSSWRAARRPRLGPPRPRQATWRCAASSGVHGRGRLLRPAADPPVELGPDLRRRERRPDRPALGQLGGRPAFGARMQPRRSTLGTPDCAAAV